MNVLHLVWNLIRGGTEGQCARVAMELARRGRDTHRVMVFRREGFFLDAVEQTCGPVHDIGITGFLRIDTVRAIRHWGRELRRGGVQLLHAWDADAAIFGQAIAARAGIPLITSRRDLGQIYPAHKVWLMRRADRRAVRTVANAQAIVDAFHARGDDTSRFVVIPNILDVAEFDVLHAAPFGAAGRLPPGERLVMVCRLDAEKDVPTFILAADMILKSRPEASFVVAGDGVLRAQLEAMAANRGLAGRMVFLGDVREVPALLAHARIGVLTPSRNEGLSNTILEYMAAGLPVVATDCGGNRELVDPPVGGMIVPPGDAEALSRACVELLRRQELRQAAGAANRKAVLERFQPGPVADRFDRLYRDALGQA